MIKEEFLDILEWIINQPFFEIDTIEELIDDYECYLNLVKQN